MSVAIPVCFQEFKSYLRLLTCRSKSNIFCNQFRSVYISESEKFSNESIPVTAHRMSFTIQLAITSTKKNIFKGRVEVIGSLLLTKLEFTYKANGTQEAMNCALGLWDNTL